MTCSTLAVKTTSLKFLWNIIFSDFTPIRLRNVQLTSISISGADLAPLFVSPALASATSYVKIHSLNKDKKRLTLFDDVLLVWTTKADTDEFISMG